jgi:DNA primase
VPYRLPEVIEAIAAGHPIFIVEGEAKADLLANWNVAATCCAGGARKWREEHNEYLRDADVVLLPDNDGAGWQHVNSVGASLVSIAKRVRVLVLPHARAKDDIVDWAKAGGTREQLDALLAEAQDWKAPTAEQINKEKDESEKREDELIAALAKLQPGINFHRQREEAAKELKVSKSAIDAEIKARREAVPLHGHWHVEPWEEPADGDSLLRDIIRRSAVTSFVPSTTPSSSRCASSSRGSMRKPQFIVRCC